MVRKDTANSFLEPESKKQRDQAAKCLAGIKGTRMARYKLVE
jgi:hypothetical protein